MKIVHRANIDTERWDYKIANSAIDNIFCYSWYLDSTAKDWCALVSENYKTVLPLPFAKKLGVKQLYQPQFSREIDIFGAEFSWEDALPILQNEFKAVQFRTAMQLELNQTEQRVHQILRLNEPFALSTNAKRLIKKASDFRIETADDPQILISIFKKTAFKKIDTISDADLKSLKTLMTEALQNNAGELMIIKNGAETVGAGFFLKDKKRITYLKGACFEQEKKSGAMFKLIYSALECYQSNYELFDFGGSNIENVANFYRKFGASDRTYYNYQLKDLPKWYKAIKRLKK